MMFKCSYNCQISEVLKSGKCLHSMAMQLGILDRNISSVFFRNLRFGRSKGERGSNECRTLKNLELFGLYVA